MATLLEPPTEIIEETRGIGRHSHISREELCTSDELFLTGTAAGVTPVREVDGRKIGNNEWPVTRCLQKAYDEVDQGGSPKHSNWLTLVKGPGGR